MNSLWYASSLPSALRSQCAHIQRTLRPVFAPSLSGVPLVSESRLQWSGSDKTSCSSHSRLLFQRKRYTNRPRVEQVWTVSITDYAQKSFGDVVLCRTTRKKGETIQQGGESSLGQNQTLYSFFFCPVLENSSRCLLASRGLYWRRGRPLPLKDRKQRAHMGAHQGCLWEHRRNSSLISFRRGPFFTTDSALTFKDLELDVSTESSRATY